MCDNDDLDTMVNYGRRSALSQVAAPRGSLRKSTPITWGTPSNWVTTDFQSDSQADCG